MTDVTALGEILIDFTPAGITEQGYMLFQQNPGGAPANVLALLSKYGRSGALIGKVGCDVFGNYLRQVLEDNKIGVRGLVSTDEANTTLAFVHLHEDGERSFSFHRKPGADQQLQSSEVDYSLIEGSKIFHVGSLSLTDEPSRSATWAALKHARDHGVLISYDPNLRRLLWNDPSEAKRLILQGMDYADIVKISDEELQFLTNTEDLEAGSCQLVERYDISLLLISLGPEGCFYRRGPVTGRVPGFVVKVIDTTGAGDVFLGGWLYKYLTEGKSVDQLSIDELEAMLRFANAAGALTTTKKGAIPALPELEDVIRLVTSGDTSEESSYR